MVRKWQPTLRHAVLEYHASVQRLKDTAAGDVPSGVNLLTRIIDALEAYLQVAPPSGPGLGGEATSARITAPAQFVSIATTVMDESAWPPSRRKPRCDLPPRPPRPPFARQRTPPSLIRRDPPHE